MNILIKNAFVVNEGQIIQQDLRVKGDQIHQIGSGLTPLEGEEIIEAKGKLLLSKCRIPFHKQQQSKS